jgi:hypothetical protein
MRDCTRVLLFGLVLCCGAVACGGSGQSEPPATTGPATTVASVGELRLASLELGRSVNSDNTMHDATVIFIPTDVVWVSVVINGMAAHATLKARWLSATGQLISESTQELTPAGQTTAALRVSGPGAWKPGKYQVEVLIDGQRLGTKEFEVRVL